VETSGLNLLKTIKSADSHIEVLMITGFPNTDSAIEAMKNGAYDYIVKPFDKEKIEQAVKKGIIRRTQNKLQNSLFFTLMKELTN
jgi:DNA-binding NtrC family response regulator